MRFVQARPGNAADRREPVLASMASDLSRSASNGAASRIAASALNLIDAEASDAPGGGAGFSTSGFRSVSNANSLTPVMAYLRRAISFVRASRA